MKQYLLISTTSLFLFGQLLSQNGETVSESFHSNFGVQEIVEVGTPIKKTQSISRDESNSQKIDVNESEERKIISEPILGTPLGSLKNAPPLALPSNEKSLEESFQPLEDSNTPAAETSGLSFITSLQIGLRAYNTSNVLRQRNSLAENSGVFEANAGLGFSTTNIELGKYVTMIPRIDLFMQLANYQERPELLDYRFGMAKGNLQFGFPKDWSVNFSLDYNVLHSLETKERFFDSVSPGLSLQKLFPITEESFFIIESSIRSANMDAVKVFEAAGIFPDSGNNYQTSLSATYIHQFGNDMEWTLMPRIAINRTNYTVSPNTGRLDYLFTGGASLIYQWNEWFGMQVFWTYSSMSSDTIDDFNVHDFGAVISSSYQF